MFNKANLYQHLSVFLSCFVVAVVVFLRETSLNSNFTDCQDGYCQIGRLSGSCHKFWHS